MAGIKGKSGGYRKNSGRKAGSNAQKGIRDILKIAWPEEQRIRTAILFATRAEKGDLESYKLLLAYGYGKPKEIHEISGPDGSAVPVDVAAAFDKAYGTKS